MKLIAKWVLEYDMHTDKCYKHPGCPKCDMPIYKDKEDGLYHCLSCGEEVFMEDPRMIKWMQEREETKTEYEDCFLGCGGEKCVKVHYRRNPVTMEWQQAYGECEKCGLRFIV